MITWTPEERLDIIIGLALAPYMPGNEMSERDTLALIYQIASATPESLAPYVDLCGPLLEVIREKRAQAAKWAQAAKSAQAQAAKAAQAG